jgi:hypothetical protein
LTSLNGLLNPRFPLRWILQVGKIMPTGLLDFLLFVASVLLTLTAIYLWVTSVVFNCYKSHYKKSFFSLIIPPYGIFIVAAGMYKRDKDLSEFML